MNLKMINLVMFVLMILMNYLANALPLNGKTTGELSAQYPNLFVPAGVTFSIWGVIYLLLLVFVILQFNSSNRQVVMNIGWAFAISSLFNAAWIAAWHYEKLPLSLIIMLGLLLSLVFINFQLRGSAPVFFRIAFGIYLGWISIATIANVTALLVAYQWGGWGISPQTWAIILIGAGTLITAWALIRLNNPYIALAVIWAFVGIILRQQGKFPAIVAAAAAGIAIMAIVMIWGFLKARPQLV